MTKSTLVVLGILALAPRAFAQPQKPVPMPMGPLAIPPPPAVAQAKDADIVSLRVLVTVATYQGDKKVSSVPYTLSVNAAPNAFGPNMPPSPFNFMPSQLRMGVRVPVPTMAPPTVDGKRVDGMVTAGPVVYEDIGTNIDCSATAMGDGRFQLQLSIEDKSLASPSPTSRPGDPPVFRTFRLSNQLILRDGQSTQFTAATDRVTGEQVRIEVSVSIAK
jgi:hypothetical protein